MPYEPLHHKYRPQRFADLVGQQAIAQTLTNALQQNRIAPAYLFAGPRGTGKTSSARILAKSLNCLSSEGPTAEPCGHCQTCVEITQGRALDVVEIDAASNTGVDNIRELIERAQFAPVQCRYKVYVLDEVHMLSGAAFNALLKTLEEPPAHVVFVLATTDPQRVLPTIISRCQRFDFRRIPLVDMVSHLGTIAQQESIEIVPEALTLVAQIAQGGLRDAESLLDQLSLVPTGVTVEAVWDLVGAVPERDLLALVSSLAAGDAEGAVDCLRRLMDRGREPTIVLQNLASFYRDLLIAKTAPDRGDLVALTEPTWQQLCEFARSQELSWILHGQQYLKTGESLLKNSTQPRLWLEVTLMGLLPGAVAPVGAVGSVAPMPPRPIAPISLPAPVPAPIAPVSVPASSDPLSALLAQLGLDPGAIARFAQGVTQWAQTNPAVLMQLIGLLQSMGGVAPAPIATSTPTATPPSATTVPAAIAPVAAVPQPAPVPTPAPEPAPVSAGPDETFAPEPNPIAPVPASAELDQLWQAILVHVQPPATKMMLSQMGQLLSFDGQNAVVGIPPSWVAKFESRTKAIETAFQQHLQRSVTVAIRANVVMSPQASAPASFPKNPPRGTPPPPPNPARNPNPMPTTAANPTAGGFGGIATRVASPPTASPALLPTAPAANPLPAPGRAPAPAPDRPVRSPQPPPAASPQSVSPPSPAGPPPPPGPDDLVARSARSLAQLFNGEIVQVDDLDMF